MQRDRENIHLIRKRGETFMKRKHLIIALVVVGALMIASTVGMDYLWGRVLDYTPTMRQTWELSMPSAAKWETLFGSEETEEGVMCHVLTYKKEEVVAQMLDWEAVSDEAQQTATTWLGEMEITEELWPKWEQCRFYGQEKDDGDRLLLFWDSESILLYVLESAG